MSRPLIIAHRGGAPDEIENSAAAFSHALTSGVDMLECDVRRTADGELVLLHDAIARIDGRRVVVADAPRAALRAALPWLLTVDEFLEGYGRALPFNLDLKTHGFEAQVLAALRRHGVVEQALISTVHIHSLRRLAAAEPRPRLGLSRGHLNSSVPTRAATLWLQAMLPLSLPPSLALARATATMLHYRVVSHRLVTSLHARGYRVFAWTVDDPATARRLAARGVDGIASNLPARLIEAWRDPSAVGVATGSSGCPSSRHTVCRA